MGKALTVIISRRTRAADAAEQLRRQVFTRLGQRGGLCEWTPVNHDTSFALDRNTLRHGELSAQLERSDITVTAVTTGRCALFARTMYQPANDSRISRAVS